MIVKGADELAAKLDRIAGRLENPAGAEPLVTTVLRDRIARVFTSDGDGAWPAHTAATVERWGEHSLMRLSGALEAALTGGRAEASGSEQLAYRPAQDLFYGAIATASRPITVDATIADEVAAVLAEHAFGGET